jgi:hypothetical protein
MAFFRQVSNYLEEQLVVRKDMDVNEHERLSIFTPRHKPK